MTAPSSIDPAGFLHDQLESASPDLLRSMLATFVNTLMSGRPRVRPGTQSPEKLAARFSPGSSADRAGPVGMAGYGAGRGVSLRLAVRLLMAGASEGDHDEPAQPCDQREPFSAGITPPSMPCVAALCRDWRGCPGDQPGRDLPWRGCARGSTGSPGRGAAN